MLDVMGKSIYTEEKTQILPSLSCKQHSSSYPGIFILRFITRQLAALEGIPLFSDMSYRIKSEDRAKPLCSGDVSAILS